MPEVACNISSALAAAICGDETKWDAAACNCVGDCADSSFGKVSIAGDEVPMWAVITIGVLFVLLCAASIAWVCACLSNGEESSTSNHRTHYTARQQSAGSKEFPSQYSAHESHKHYAETKLDREARVTDWGEPGGQTAA